MKPDNECNMCSLLGSWIGVKNKGVIGIGGNLNMACSYSISVTSLGCDVLVVLMNKKVLILRKRRAVVLG